MRSLELLLARIANHVEVYLERSPPGMQIGEAEVGLLPHF